MKIKKIIIPFLAVTMAGIASANNFNEVMGNEWYERRAEGADGIYAKPEPINNAIAFYENACSQMATEENAVALLKCYYFKGSFVPMKIEQQEALFNKGKNFGEKMALRFPSSAKVKYWLAAMWGKWAKACGALEAARKGAADRIRELSEEVCKLDPTYNDAGGFEILGLVHFHSPRIPFFLTWPSNNMAITYLQKAATLAPTIANNLCYAKALLKTGNEIQAIDLLKKTAKMAPRKEKLVEDRNGLTQVNELLAGY